MKTKNLSVWCILIALLLGVASCTPNAVDEVEPAVLSVTAQELTFQNGGGSETVKITTNQPSWVATCPQEGSWVELIPSGNNLTINVSKNVAAESRTTYVLVSAGGATARKIKLTQTPAGTVLALLPEAINVPETGGTYIVDISSNSNMWELEITPEVEWATVSVHKAAKLAYVTVQPNAETAERETVLRATNKGESVEVQIKQAAAANLRYIMPLLNKRVASHELIEFETQRKGFLKFMAKAIPDFGMWEEGYTFSNKSKLFPETIYRVHSGTNSLTKVLVLTKEYDAVLAEKDQLLAFYKENGFDFPEPIGKEVIQGRHETAPFEISINFNKNDKIVLITFSQYAKQPKPYPTFDQMPDFPIQYFYNPAWKFAEIDAVEKAEGATELLRSEIQEGKYAGEVDVILYTCVDAKKPLINTGYFFDWKESTPADKLGQNRQYLAMYNDPSLAFWHDTEVSGSIVLTDEIKALLKKEGWALHSVNKGTYLFFHSVNKLVLGLSYAQFNEINGGAPVLQMNLFPEDLGDGSSNSAAVQKRLLEKIESAKIKFRGK